MNHSVIAEGTPTSSVPAARRTWGEWIAWVATEDHCEWANQYVAWLRTPLGILLIGAVCALLCGLFVAPQGYAVAAAILAVVAVGLVWPVVAIRGVQCRFEFAAPRGREGQAVRAKLTVTNRWPWPIWGLTVSDPLRPDSDEASLSLARTPGWSTATFNCSLTPEERGVYPQREVRFGTGFPFGLYEASRPADTPRPLIVWPRTFWLPSLDRDACRLDWRGAATERRAGNQGTRLGVRDHRSGDSLRDVHWAKTARYDRLIVSERESATVEDATILLPLDAGDCRRDSAADDPTLAWRFRIAASVCESFSAHQGQVDLWLGGERHSVGRRPGDLADLLDALAKHDPSDETRPKAPSGVKSASTVITIAAADGKIVVRHTSRGANKPRRFGSRRGEALDQIEVEPGDTVPERVLRGWRRGTQSGGVRASDVAADEARSGVSHAG